MLIFHLARSHPENTIDQTATETDTILNRLANIDFERLFELALF
jgi:hypothetical protein